MDIELSSEYVLGDGEIKRLPDGSVGVKFPIPEVRAFDWYYGNTENVSYKIINTDNQCDYTSEVINGNFIPSVSGNYQVIYSADNGKKISLQVYEFEILEILYG